MKGQYNIYPFFTSILHKQLRKAEPEHKNATVRDALKLLFDNSPHLTQSMNYTIISEEHYWMEQSRVVIFPESVDILDRLSEAKFSIDKSAGVQFPHDCFVLAFPKDFELNGIQANSCMVSYMERPDRFENIHVPFFKYLDLGTPVYVPDKHTKGLYMSYVSPNESEVLIRACIPTDIIASCLQAKTAHEYGEIVGGFSRDKMKEFIPLNDADLEYQFALFQIVVRVGVYSTACESALRSGYPHVRPKHLEPKGMSYIDYSLGTASETRTVGAHYRSWYFRQLNHKKYYQNEHAKKPIGSRIVFVKDTMINLDIDAETLE